MRRRRRNKIFFITYDNSKFLEIFVTYNFFFSLRKRASIWSEMFWKWESLNMWVGNWILAGRVKGEGWERVEEYSWWKIVSCRSFKNYRRIRFPQTFYTYNKLNVALYNKLMMYLLVNRIKMSSRSYSENWYI